jgi:hypothetical protein
VPTPARRAMSAMVGGAEGVEFMVRVNRGCKFKTINK